MKRFILLFVITLFMVSCQCADNTDNQSTTTVELNNNGYKKYSNQIPRYENLFRDRMPPNTEIIAYLGRTGKNDDTFITKYTSPGKEFEFCMIGTDQYYISAIPCNSHRDTVIIRDTIYVQKPVAGNKPNKPNWEF